MVVGSAQQLANCSKGPQEKRVKDTQIPPIEVPGEKKEGARAGKGEGEGAEGLFPGMERVLAPQGSVMVWNSAQAQGESTITACKAGKAALEWSKYRCFWFSQLPWEAANSLLWCYLAN